VRDEICIWRLPKWAMNDSEEVATAAEQEEHGAISRWNSFARQTLIPAMARFQVKAF
jgi:hypothetical protein